MNPRLYFYLIGAGVFIALGSLGVQMYLSQGQQTVRVEKRAEDSEKVCALAQSWQSLMKEQHPEQSRIVPNLEVLTLKCPLEK